MQDLFMKIFENATLELTAKIIGVITAIVAILYKIKEYFSIYRSKQNLKNDLEILKLSQENNLDASTKLNAQLNESLNNIYFTRSRKFKSRIERIQNIVYGLFVFIGFGYWTFSIAMDSGSFSGWILIPAFLSLVGLLMIFDKPDEVKEGQIESRIPVVTIKIYSFSGIVMGLVSIIGFGYINYLAFTIKNAHLIFLVFTIPPFILGFFGIFNNLKFTTKNDINNQKF